MDTSYINYIKAYWDIILVVLIWLAIAVFFRIKKVESKEVNAVEDIELSRQSKGRLSSLNAMAGISQPSVTDSKMNGQPVYSSPLPEPPVYNSPLPEPLDSSFKSLDDKGFPGCPASLFDEDTASRDVAAPEEETDRSALLTQYTSGDGGGVDEMERMLAVDPDNLQLMDWLAFMYYSNDEIDKAVAAYSKIIALEPGNASQHYYLGNCYCKMGNNEQARIQWEEVQRLKPGSKYAQKAGNRMMKLSS